MKVYDVVWLAGAEDDLTSIFSKELDHSGNCTNAAKLVDEIEGQLKHLVRFPLIGRKVTQHLRRLLVGKQKYGLYYEVQPTRIMIHAILSLHQPPQQIKDRLDL